jgi:hypothetical protein
MSSGKREPDDTKPVRTDGASSSSFLDRVDRLASDVFGTRSSSSPNSPTRQVKPERMMDPRELAQAITTAAAALPAAAVTAKLPSFWKNAPDLWFVRVEAEFVTANITVQATKYSHVIKALPEDVAQDVSSLIKVTPADHPYDLLKAALLKACEPTPSEKVCRFHLLTLGDLRPSQLLNRMLDLQPEGTDAQWYRQAFLGKLPMVVQLQLATDGRELPLLAIAADALVEVYRRQPLGAAAHALQPPEPVAGDDVALQAALAAVYTRFGRSAPAKGPRPPRAADSAGKQDGYCFFHKRFGVKAKKCALPCSYHPAGNGGGS